MYFEAIPQIVYAFPFNSGDNIRIVRDITMNLRPLREVIENMVYYEDYDINDGDTPEIIAERVYGDPKLHWVLMLVNEKFHYLDDFPIPENRMDDYITELYGEGNENSTHQLYGRNHYVSPEGNVVDSDYPLATEITNTEYERELNQSKRRIRIISPKLINIFVKDLQEAFQE